jgi:outer membrane receptor protein involved in Fe transport
MKSYQNTAGDPTKRWLGFGLAALMATSVAIGQTVTPRSADSDEDDRPIILSPFTVESEADYGYLKTNSATATRIGTEIQRIPLNVSVISEEFIQDTNMSDIQDVLRYQATSSGDTRMGILQPGNAFTPSGIFTLRGFPVNARMRNSLLRYNNYTLDNIERVEIIKGPAAVFFGQAFPGGVINYVTKKPQFRNIPTNVSYSYGGNVNKMGSQRVTLDHNVMLSDRAALRVVGAWDNSVGFKNYEFQKGYSITPSMTFRPFEDDRLRINIEAEQSVRRRNISDASFIHNEQWFRDYANPPPALIAAAPAAIQNAADPVAAWRNRIFGNIGNWIADVRAAAGDPFIALWTDPMIHGAMITDANGNRVQDKKFNPRGAGSYADEENTTFSIDAEYTPNEWFNLRYNYTLANNRFTEERIAASPNADGITWNALSGLVKRDYIQKNNNTHQLDLVFSHDFRNTRHKLLVGGLRNEVTNFFTGNIGHANLNPMFGYLPGAYDKPDEGYVSPIPPEFRHPIAGWGVREQFVRDRNGNIITPQQIFTHYDPGVHISPPISRIMEVSRGLIDSSRPKREEYYINYQMQAFEDRLTVMLGMREEKQTTPGQLVQANPPWFVAPDFALENIPQSQWQMYGLSALFSRPRVSRGDSQMAGISFEITPNVNVYASYSQSYVPTSVRFLGGDYNPEAIRTRAIDLGLNPDTELARIAATGGDDPTKNETGTNKEIGLKTNLWDNRLVTTFSFFQLERANRNVDDIPRQQADPINWTGPGNTGTYNRILRWYANSAVQRTEGFEFESIWTPIRNYQAVVSGSWLWTAKTVSDDSLVPGSPLHTIVFGNRLPNAPKYRFNVFQKYTFTEGIGGFAQGASLGVGTRYSSKANFSLDQNFNPQRGGFTSGDYLVFDTVIGYPFEVGGYRMTASLNVNNVFNTRYSEGGFNLSNPRSWVLRMGMSF